VLNNVNGNTQDQTSAQKCIDKTTFFEYCQLPGIMSDRFFNITSDKEQKFIGEHNFIASFIRVFISNVDTKMKLTFNM